MRNSPPMANASANSQSPSCIHARLPQRHQAIFAAFVPRERPQLAFFTPCCKKITQRNINFLLRELPSRRWLDAAVLRICVLFYCLKRAFNWSAAAIRLPRDYGNRLSVGIYLFAIVKSCALARPRRPNHSRAGLVSGEPDCQQEAAILPRRTAHGSVRLRQASAPVPSSGILLRAAPPARRAVCD